MQLKFLLKSLRESDVIQSELVATGIPANDIHFVSERAEQFAGHNIQEASLLEERDLLHSIVRGVVAGGIIAVMACLFIYAVQPYNWQLQPVNVLFIMLLCGGFGGWTGGLFGISHRNYRLSEYEDELKKGKAILLVYTDPAHSNQTEKMVLNRHPDVVFLGRDSDYDNPLKSAKPAELEH